jgi:Cu/Ag efflux protein CusF
MKCMWMLAAVMSLGTAAYAAQQQNGGMPPMVESQQASMTARVEGIDHAARSVTLRGEGGKTQSFTVPPEVKNFDQIKKGDNVVVDYYRSVLVEMAQPGEEMKAPSASDTVKVAPPGDKPSAAKAKVRRATVTVRTIDKDNGTVTVALPGGETRTVVVSEERRPMLERIKVGDKIAVTLTEAVAVAVRKP